MKALIDTCVIIDALQSRDGFKDDAESIFLLSANNKFDGFITAKSVTDIYYLTHKLTHSDKKTRDIISKLFVLFDPLDTKGIDCKKAVSSEIKDYEDAVMVETAISNNIDCIVSRNIKDYKLSHVTAYTPDQFVLLISSQNQND